MNEQNNRRSQHTGHYKSDGIYIEIKFNQFWHV